MYGRLGHTYSDKVSGFTGVAISHCVHITGSSQTLLLPKGESPSKYTEAVWLDDDRLCLEGVERVTINTDSAKR